MQPAGAYVLLYGYFSMCVIYGKGRQRSQDKGITQASALLRLERLYYLTH